MILFKYLRALSSWSKASIGVTRALRLTVLQLVWLQYWLIGMTLLCKWITLS